MYLAPIAHVLLYCSSVCVVLNAAAEVAEAKCHLALVSVMCYGGRRMRSCGPSKLLLRSAVGKQKPASKLMPINRYSDGSCLTDPYTQHSAAGSTEASNRAATWHGILACNQCTSTWVIIGCIDQAKLIVGRM